MRAFFAKIFYEVQFFTSDGECLYSDRIPSIFAKRALYKACRKFFRLYPEADRLTIYVFPSKDK